jgi:hypothetical protein
LVNDKVFSLACGFSRGVVVSALSRSDRLMEIE